MRSSEEIHPHRAAALEMRVVTTPSPRHITRQELDAVLAADGPLSPARRAALQAAPGFSDAIQRTAAGLAEHHRGNRLLNVLIGDRGRFFAAMFVLDLHSRRHDEGIGLTPGRLKQLCVEQGICSATRAGALLALMKLGGYVEAAPRSRDRRLRELVPTEKLIAQQRARWRCYLDGASELLPDAGRALEMLDRPAFVDGVIRLMSAHFRAGFRFVDHAPGLHLFSERNGGMFVLFSLLAKAPLEDDAPIAVSISELARSISASRVHVAKLLKDAERQGLLQRSDQASVRILPPLQRDVREFFALGFMSMAYFAGAVPPGRAAEQEADRSASAAPPAQ